MEGVKEIGEKIATSLPASVRIIVEPPASEAAEVTERNLDVTDPESSDCGTERLQRLPHLLVVQLLAAVCAVRLKFVVNQPRERDSGLNVVAVGQRPSA